MENKFVKTKNFKNFVSLASKLKNLPDNIPRLALIYSEPGIGKTHMLLKWALDNDAVYIRAINGMTQPGLLKTIVTDLDLTDYHNMQTNFNHIVKSLQQEPRVIIVDEVDYLIGDKNVIEILRDIQDITNVPIILSGMEFVNRKIARFKHIKSRLYKSLKLKYYDSNEKYIAIINDSQFTIEIYKVHKDFDQSELDNKLHCEIETSTYIKDCKLNPIYLDILLVATLNDIEFFEIPANSEENLITNPKFIFKESKAIINSVEFNPFNSHIISSSYCDKTIQIWSIRKPFIQLINCSEIPLEMKWQQNGYLLGFIEYNQLKIYDRIYKKTIFKLNFNESCFKFEFFGNEGIIICNKKRNKIFYYKYSANSKGILENKSREQYKEVLEIEYNSILSNKDYFIIYSDERISVYDKFTNSILVYRSLF